MRGRFEIEKFAVRSKARSVDYRLLPKMRFFVPGAQWQTPEKKARVHRNFFAHGKGRGENHAWSMNIGPREKSHGAGVTFQESAFSL